jgi:hypothetical protein
MAFPLAGLAIGAGVGLANKLFGGSGQPEMNPYQKAAFGNLMGFIPGYGARSVSPFIQSILGRSEKGREMLARLQAQSGGSPGDPYMQELMGLGAGAPDVQAFMNPYQQQVIDQMRPEFDRQRSMALGALDQRATQAGAFGGSRHGVAQGVALGEVGRAESDAIARLMYGGYQDAMGQALQQQGFRAGILGTPFQRALGIAGVTAGLPQQQPQPGFFQSILGGAMAGAGVQNQFFGGGGASQGAGMIGGSAIGGISPWAYAPQMWGMPR